MLEKILSKPQGFWDKFGSIVYHDYHDLKGRKKIEAKKGWDDRLSTLDDGQEKKGETCQMLITVRSQI